MKEELKNFLSLKGVSIQRALCRRLPNTQTALYVRFQERDLTNLVAAAFDDPYANDAAADDGR